MTPRRAFQLAAHGPPTCLHPASGERGPLEVPRYHTARGREESCLRCSQEVVELRGPGHAWAKSEDVCFCFLAMI